MERSLIDGRIERLERETRALRRICAGLTLALVAVTAIGAAASGRFAAREFTVIDADGNTRVKIDAQGFHLLDGSGTERLAAAFDAKTSLPHFALNDATGHPRFEAYLDGKPNQGFVAIRDAKYARAILGSVNGTSPQLWIGDASGNRRIAIGMSLEKSASNSIPFMDFEAKSVGETAYFGPNNITFGNDKTSRAYFGRFGGFPEMKLHDKSGVERGYFGMYSEGTMGAFFKDGSGAVTWKAH